MITIFVKGPAEAAAAIIGQPQLKVFNHAIRFHGDAEKPHHIVLDLSVPNASTVVGCLLADCLAIVSTRIEAEQLKGTVVGSTFLDISKKQFMDWKDSGYPNVDAPCIPFLETINKHPRYTTMHCCAGHRDDQVPDSDVFKDVFARNGYVSIAGELSSLILLDLTLTEIITKAANKDYAGISIRRHQSCLPQNVPVFALPFVYHPVLVIRWVGKTQAVIEQRRKLVEELLTTALSQIKEI